MPPPVHVPGAAALPAGEGEGLTERAKRHFVEAWEAVGEWAKRGKRAPAAEEAPAETAAAAELRVAQHEAALLRQRAALEKELGAKVIERTNKLLEDEVAAHAETRKTLQDYLKQQHEREEALSRRIATARAEALDDALAFAPVEKLREAVARVPPARLAVLRDALAPPGPAADDETTPPRQQRGRRSGAASSSGA